MINTLIILVEIDKNEVFRYLGYNGQNIDENIRLI